MANQTEQKEIGEGQRSDRSLPVCYSLFVIVGQDINEQDLLMYVYQY